MEVYSKIQHLLADEPSDWLADSKQMEIEEYTPWLKTSQTVALRILGRLREINMSQNELADKIGISRQQVNKWLKGRENFTIETLTKLGGPVGMTLEELVQPFSKKNAVHMREEKAAPQLREKFKVHYEVSGSVHQEGFKPINQNIEEGKVRPLYEKKWQEFQAQQAL